jgi:hypothetical protein
MHVVFLDMDGVLNSVEWFRSQECLDADKGIAPDPHTDYWWTRMIDPAAVERLNQIVEATEAKVVISSSWRYHNDPPTMQRYLDARGFRGEVIGRTPLAHQLPEGIRDMGGIRGQEIQTWLVKNVPLMVDGFVILDDMGAGAFAHMATYLVQSTWGFGLLDKHVPAAIEKIQAGA